MSKNPLVTVVVLGAVFVFSGCSDGGSEQQTPKEKIAQLENLGALPKLDRSDDIAGKDGNGNGIRDDIETHIIKNYTSTEQRAAAMQSARAFQNAILIDLTDINDVKDANKRISRADHCIYSKFNETNSSKKPAEVSQEIESMTTNTKLRLKAYLAYIKTLDGTSWAMPEGDTCE